MTTTCYLDLVSNLSDSEAQFRSFHQRCRGMCSSRKQFFACFDIDESHILIQGLAKNTERLALKDEDIASVIKSGELNLSRCEAKNWGLVIAIEGKFENFAWIDFSGTGPMMENVEPLAQVRVIVRERKPRHLVVTAYVLRPPENRLFVEVPRGIWE